MKDVHVECNPDEVLVKKLGVSRKRITHHQGKSRVFKACQKKNNLLALVDEDPGSHRTPYENTLTLEEQYQGISYYKDRSGNEIFILNGKLEDWIISICQESKVEIATFGLPGRPNDLHDVINQKLDKFAVLLDALLEAGSPALVRLRSWLN